MQTSPEKNSSTPACVPSDSFPARSGILGADLEAASADSAAPQATPRREIGGPPGPEPTRFGDWERKGRCIDF
ncbi:MAG: DUF1674 domain-containing protein [Steroidobacteraceae bacterium]